MTCYIQNVQATEGIDTVYLQRCEENYAAPVTTSFNPKIDKINLQGYKSEDLAIVNYTDGVLIHYIPKKWQIDLARDYEGMDEFIIEQINTGKFTPGVAIQRNYDDITFWGTRPYSDGRERAHTFRSPEGSLDDFVFLVSNSDINQFNTWDNGKIVFLGSKKKTASPSQPNKALEPISRPSKFKSKNSDKITNFNPSTDTLEIDTDSFGIDSSATFASGKNKKEVKKKLAKQDFDFLYDEKKGGLYFNENGSDKGFGEGGIIAILKGAPDLTSDNLEFI